MIFPSLNLHFLSSDLKHLEQRLLENLSSKLEVTDTIGAHIIKSGGKRIRPILFFLTFHAFDVSSKDKNIHDLACVIEYVHNATLLHDDVVDKASLRHNRITASERWGNSQSVLVGDFLFTKAFEILSNINNIRLVQTFSRVTNQLSLGELLQLQTTVQTITEDIYFEIISSKTAVLIAISMEFAGIYTNQSKEICDKLYDIGHSLGIAFQLVDDALDYNSENKLLGKEAGADLQEHKVTLPLFYLLKQSTSQEKAQVQVILKKEKIGATDITLIQEYMQKYNCIQQTLDVAETFTSKATDKLRSLGQSNKYIDTIIKLSSFILERKY